MVPQLLVGYLYVLAWGDKRFPMLADIAEDGSGSQERWERRSQYGGRRRDGVNFKGKLLKGFGRHLRYLGLYS